MFILLQRRHSALFVTGMLATISAGCSKPPERPRSLESASSPAPTTVADTMARTDTSAAQPDVASPADTPATKPAPQEPAKTPTLPKPSIDPGRKSPKPRVIPQPTAAPPPDTAASSPTPAGQDQWLKYDAASNTVTFELIAGPFNFNGYTSGGATLVIPPKANVVMNFVNKDGTPHSAEIISGEGPLPNAAVEAAIPRAYTNKLLEGLPQEGSDVMRFTVPESGSYRIFCGVPGHGLSGMWIWMRVDASAKTPSFGPTKG
jgi:hypothetical protein